MSGDLWRRCSSCKRDIAWNAVYQVCNVSTCNQKRTGLVFCTTECWDTHLGYVNHRESWAVEKRAPSRESAASAARPTPPVRTSGRTIVRPSTANPSDTGLEGDAPRDILIVASKLKAYVKARSGMNTSDRVLEALSDEVRKLADRAIRSARAVERKTLLDRDFEPGGADH